VPLTPLQIAKYLILGCALVAGIRPCAVAQRVNSSPDTTTVAEQYLLAAANQERTERGLLPLHRNSQLAHAATQHARAMATHASISHQFAGESDLTDRGAGAGVAFSVISENVGEAPSVVTIHDMWMHSEHHRTNLLDPSVDSIGISVIARGGELYAVEDFAKTVRSVSLEQQEAAIAALVAQSDVITLANGPNDVSAARETCSMSTGYAGPRKPWFVMRFTSDSLTQLPGQLKTKLASGRYHEAAVGACAGASRSPFTSYNFAVLLYP
jgi:Cysteine-rich secretory protein family